MDFIDFFNDIAARFRTYFSDTLRDLKIAFEIEKQRYQLRLYTKRRDNILLNIGRSMYDNYRISGDGACDFSELFTLSEILDSFIEEKRFMIKSLTDRSSNN